MPVFQLYSKLLELPLFQGLGHNDLDAIVSQTKFGFSKYKKGETIVNEDDVCAQLMFLLNGSVQAEAHSDDHGYRLTEFIDAPDVLQPDRIFGLHQRYTATFRAADDANFLTIDKREVSRLSDKYAIFRLNLLNLICTRSQRFSRRPWRSVPQSLEERIVRFIEAHCLRPAGEKVFHIKMTRLADELNDSRLDVSRALNNMQRQGLLRLSRGMITVPALEKLITI